MNSQIVYKKEASLQELDAVAKEILKLLPKSAIVFLEGNLAAGKTTLVNKMAKQLGLRGATSPTFTLQQVYGKNFFHYDFYRSSFEEIISIGIFDEFEKEGLHFIEWPSKELKELLKEAGMRLFVLEITPKENKREYKLKAINA